MFPKSVSWLGREKQSLTQQKHQSKEMYYNKINTKALKPGLVSCVLRHLPGNGEVLFLFWHFINLSLT